MDKFYLKINIKKMNKKLASFAFLAFVFLATKAQKIELYFPHFAGKTYDFIIFKGSQQETLIKGTIPEGGNFTLEIPEKYSPYVGMGRWLITNSREGGGLDMYIPGKDFSVSCTEENPSEDTIIYKENTGNKELNDLYRKQNAIIQQYRVISEALKIFPKNNKTYRVFKKEHKRITKEYNKFQEELRKENSYITQLLQIININSGISTKLIDSEEEKSLLVADYILNDLNWDYLYTSGYWYNVISSWFKIHTEVIKDVDKFESDFQKLTSKIDSPIEYKDFVTRIAYILKNEKNEEYIEAISPIILESEKIEEFSGVLDIFLNGLMDTENSEN